MRKLAGKMGMETPWSHGYGNSSVSWQPWRNKQSNTKEVARGTTVVRTTNVAHNNKILPSTKTIPHIAQAVPGSATDVLPNTRILPRSARVVPRSPMGVHQNTTCSRVM